MELPPKDSWITLKAGQAVNIDQNVNEEWCVKTQRYRQIRGSILVSAFEIEYALDLVLAEIFFAGRKNNSKIDSEVPHPTLGVSREELRSLFDQHILKSSPMSFSRKCVLFKKFVSELQPLNALVPTDIFNRLEKVRDRRNRFAHYPVTFTPTGEPSNQSLKASLVCSDREVLLDESFLQETSDLFSSTTKDLEQVFTKLSGMLKPLPPL